MPRGKKIAAERIEVTDQVGKRHVVLGYVEPPPPGQVHAESALPPDGPVEYRLSSGRIVEKTGDHTFQTSDGRLQFRAL